jgi:cysteine-rich secretory family protein
VIERNSPSADRAELRWATSLLASLGMALSLASAAAGASPASAVSRVRATICAPGVRGELSETREMDAVAARLGRGDSLHAALGSMRPRPVVAESMHLIGLYDDRSLATAVAARFCAHLLDPRLSQIGIARSDREIWIVVAAPLELPRPADQVPVARDVLVGVNAARSKGHRCGGNWYPPAAPVRLVQALSSIALERSVEMARAGQLDHTAADGSSPADRVRRSGYVARVVGENIAGGVSSAAEVVGGWLESPGHCSNIMDPRFTEMGLAFAINPSSPLQIYWTQLFALPRQPTLAQR